MVGTKYFDSCFLKRPNSLNLHLLKSLASLDISKLIQISMDGPNTNWDVLERHKIFRSSKDFSSLFVIGSCGLHVIHGALETGTKSTEWDLHKVLHAMWKTFDESPARRDIYMRETTPQMFSHYISAKQDGGRMSLLQRGPFKSGRML